MKKIIKSLKSNIKKLENEWEKMKLLITKVSNNNSKGRNKIRTKT